MCIFLCYTLGIVVLMQVWGHLFLGGGNVYFLSVHPMKWGLVLVFLVGKLR